MKTWTSALAFILASCAYSQFEVTNTNDSGAGTLRQAIENANLISGTNNISFNIPNTDPNYSLDGGTGDETWRITPVTQLPTIIDDVVIDATTQPGTGNHKIILDGSNGIDYGLYSTSGHIELYGFYITDFTNGVGFGSVGGSTIGSAGNGNVLVNCTNGIESFFADGLIIQGNYIGTDLYGNVGLGNTTGIASATGSSAHTIGGSNPSDGNVISGNTNGITTNGAGGSTIQNNYIGTDPTGNVGLPNANGISLGSSSNSMILDNVISGNTATGIRLVASANVTIQGNSIGVGQNGTTPLGNNIGIDSYGGSPDATIGGLGAGEANIIANNTLRGIDLVGASDDRIDIIGNSFFCNGIGIDLRGGNNGIAAPAITGVTTSSVSGIGTDGDVVHVYRDNSACNPPQGQEYLGMATVGSSVSGVWEANSLSAAINVGTDVIVVTATNATDGTSEFSSQDPYIVTNTLDNGIGSLRWCMANANASSDETISFNLPGSGPWTISIDSNLPSILTTTIIDGTTQPGWSSTNLVGIQQGNAVCNWGLAVQANDCEIYGLEITGFNDSGDFGGIYTGLSVTSGQIGAPLKGNVLSNNRYGLQIQGDNIVVQGNKFGTDNTGSFANGNTDSGVYIVNGEGSTIGGPGANEGNLLSGNTFYGVGIFRSDNNVVQGNIIGMNATGLARIQNGIRGVNIGNTGTFVSNGNTIGGSGAGEGNLISGNFIDNVRIIQGANNIIQGNDIGLDANGDIVGGAFYGVWMGGSNESVTDNIIGGVAAGEGNTIAGHPTRGVWLDPGSGSVIRNSIRGNSIYCNGDLGFTFEAGANNDIVAPLVSSYTTGAGTSEVTGECTTCVAGDLIDVYRDNSTCADGQGAEYLGTVTYGSDPWTLTGLTLVTGDVIVAQVTDVSGNSSAFSAADPEIAIYQGADTMGTELTDADSEIDFGTTITGTPVDVTFTIENKGLNTLNITLPFSIVGSGYSVLTPPSNTSLAPFETENFVLRLDASMAGDYSTREVQITNNDANEGVFNFLVSGTVNEPPAPEIVVYEGTGTTGTEITNGQTDAFDIGSALISNDITATFTIENSGDAVLNISSITSSAPEFSFGVIPSTVAIGSTETISVTLDGTNSGVFNTTITINNDDADEDPFSFPINGEITAPEIEVYLGLDNTGVPVISGQLEPIEVGEQNVGANLISSFSIENIGTSLLTISSISSSSSDFIVLAIPSSVGAGSTETWSLELDGSVAGEFSSTITIVSDDPNENPFVFDVRGIISETLDIVFYDDGVPVFSESKIDLGETVVNEPLTRSFTIENPSSAQELNINGLVVDNSKFSLVNIPSFISPGGSADFDVVLDASEKGVFSGVLEIESNFEPFALQLTGEVTPRNKSIHVFNIVTPNGDGVHDFLRIQRITEYPNNKVSIFNRTGKLLFDVTGYNNEDVRFEGEDNSGQRLTAGTYYYVIELDESERKAGFIQIITN